MDSFGGRESLAERRGLLWKNARIDYAAAARLIDLALI
jgi:hypothetical protein